MGWSSGQDHSAAGATVPAAGDQCAAPSLDRDELVTSHLHLVQHVLGSLTASYPGHVDRSELWSAGALGLVDASRRFDPAAGVPFTGFAIIRIRGAILDCTRTRDLGSRGLRRTMRAVQAASEGFEDAEGRAPTDEELAALVGLSVPQLHERQAAAASTNLIHLDSGTDEGVALIDALADSSGAWRPDETVERRELLGTLRTAVRFLPHVQRVIVERSYFRGETLKDIGTTLDLSEARVSQIRGEALAALRSYFAGAYEGVPAVPPQTPGARQRSAYLEALEGQTTWRSRLTAADDGDLEGQRPARAS